MAYIGYFWFYKKFEEIEQLTVVEVDIGMKKEKKPLCTVTTTNYIMGKIPKSVEGKDVKIKSELVKKEDSFAINEQIDVYRGVDNHENARKN